MVAYPPLIAATTIVGTGGCKRRINIPNASSALVASRSHHRAETFANPTDKFTLHRAPCLAPSPFFLTDFTNVITIAIQS